VAAALLYLGGAWAFGLNGAFAQATVPDTPAGSIDAATRARVIDAAVAKINEFYVFPDVAKKMGLAVQGRAKRGEYNWEGVGVEPDIKVPAADALTTAQDLASKEVASRRGAKP
jgi:hypothetical protein